jgi:hypothetical protein
MFKYPISLSLVAISQPYFCELNLFAPAWY